MSSLTETPKDLFTFLFIPTAAAPSPRTGSISLSGLASDQVQMTAKSHFNSTLSDLSDAQTEELVKNIKAKNPQVRFCKDPKMC